MLASWHLTQPTGRLSVFASPHTIAPSLLPSLFYSLGTGSWSRQLASLTACQRVRSFALSAGLPLSDLPGTIDRWPGDHPFHPVCLVGLRPQVWAVSDLIYLTGQHPLSTLSSKAVGRSQIKKAMPLLGSKQGRVPANPPLPMRASGKQTNSTPGAVVPRFLAVPHGLPAGLTPTPPALIMQTRLNQAPSLPLTPGS